MQAPSGDPSAGPAKIYAVNVSSSEIKQLHVHSIIRHHGYNFTSEVS